MSTLALADRDHPSLPSYRWPFLVAVATIACLCATFGGWAMFARLDSAVVTLYSDPEVWELLGYEGPSYDKGGYVDRGFDDLDWLPDPRIEHEEEMSS